MSTQAVKWAMDNAPMLRTGRGKHDTTARGVLHALAEHAHASGSGAHPSVLRLSYRTGYDRSTVQRALRRLEQAGLIEAKGVVNGCTDWTLHLELRRPASDWDELEAEDAADREATAARVRRHRAQPVTHAESVTETHAECVTASAVTHAESVRNARRVRSVTHATRPEPSIEQPPVTKDSSSSPPAQTDTVQPAAQQHLEVFGAFWLIYPKKRAREEARKAWIAALARGADPQHIVAAAQGYARERANEDPKFTKHPATWLNKGCYDDEPDPQPGKPRLRAVAGGHHAYANPDNASDYETGFK